MPRCWRTRMPGSADCAPMAGGRPRWPRYVIWISPPCSNIRRALLESTTSPAVTTLRLRTWQQPEQTLTIGSVDSDEGRDVELARRGTPTAGKGAMARVGKDRAPRAVGILPSSNRDRRSRLPSSVHQPAQPVRFRLSWRKCQHHHGRQSQDSIRHRSWPRSEHVLLSSKAHDN